MTTRKRPKHHGPAHTEFRGDIAPALARELAHRAEDEAAVLRIVNRSDLLDYCLRGRDLPPFSREAVAIPVQLMQVRRIEAEAYAENERRSHAV